MKKLVKPLTIVACLAISGLSFAVSNSTEPIQGDPAQIVATAKKDTQVFHGIVKKTR